jgi:hypothetical protein
MVPPAFVQPGVRLSEAPVGAAISPRGELERRCLHFNNLATLSVLPSRETFPFLTDRYAFVFHLIDRSRARPPGNPLEVRLEREREQEATEVGFIQAAAQVRQFFR